jgi:hypothetical protein
MTEPQGGFAHPTISAMFNPPATSVSTSGPLKSPEIAHQVHRNKNSTVVGVVIATVAAVAIIVSLAIWIWHRKQRENQRRLSSPDLKNESLYTEMDISPISQELPGKVLVAEMATVQDPVELACGEIDVKRRSTMSSSASTGIGLETVR